MTDSPIEKFKRKKKFRMAVRDKAEASQAVEASLGFSESADERGGSWSSLEPPCHQRANQTKKMPTRQKDANVPTSQKRCQPACHQHVMPSSQKNMPTCQPTPVLMDLSLGPILTLQSQLLDTNDHGCSSHSN